MKLGRLRERDMVLLGIYAGTRRRGDPIGGGAEVSFEEVTATCLGHLCCEVKLGRLRGMVLLGIYAETRRRGEPIGGGSDIDF